MMICGKTHHLQTCFLIFSSTASSQICLSWVLTLVLFTAQPSGRPSLGSNLGEDFPVTHPAVEMDAQLKSGGKKNI